MVAAQWFEAARQYLPSLAQNNPLPPVDINVAIANSYFANMTEAVSLLSSISILYMHICMSASCCDPALSSTCHVLTPTRGPGQLCGQAGHLRRFAPSAEPGVGVG